MRSSVVRGSLFVACIGVINLASVIGIPAHGDVVTDWNNAALDAIRADRTAPPIASRSLAILHAAIYDAVNGIARTHEPYLVPSAVPASASREAAASAAAHQAARKPVPKPVHLASMRFTPRFSLEFPMAHKRRMELRGANSSRVKFSLRGRMMVPMRSFSHLVEVVLVFGFPRLRRFFLICCRNGDSSRRLQ